jgi:hypothetical protein
MALEPTHVVVAGTGAAYVAPEGTALPTDLTPPLATFEDIGYIDEDGVQFTFSREQEDINAWQSAEPVRVLVTSEPKTIAYNLLEFDRESILLAFRGGSISGVSPPYTYTPPDAGVSDVRAMVIDGKDGALTFRFCFPRVSLSGDVAFQLVRTDAVKPTLEFSVLASPTKWKIISDLPGFSASATLDTHADLDAAARSVGHEWSRERMTVADKQAELAEAQAAVPA